MAEELCASVTDAAARVLEREPLQPSDLHNLVNTYCASGSPEPDLSAATRQVRAQLRYRAVADAELVRRWKDAGLITKYSEDSAGRISVEFEERRVAAVAQLQLGVDDVLFENRQDLCHS